MSRTMSAPRLRRGLASVVAAGAAVAAVALTATPAHASVTVSPSTGLNPAGATVTVSGSAPVWASTATRVTLAVCNVASGVAPGSRCDALNASGFETIADYGSGIAFAVYGSFATVIVILLSFEFGAILLLLGAQVIAEYERMQRGEPVQPPTPVETGA